AVAEELSANGRKQARDNARQRTLAASRLANDADGAGARQRKRYITQDQTAPTRTVTGRDRAQLEQRRPAFGGPTRRSPLARSARGGRNTPDRSDKLTRILVPGLG